MKKTLTIFSILLVTLMIPAIGCDISEPETVQSESSITANTTTNPSGVEYSAYVVLSWSRYPGAIRYEVVIGEEPSFSIIEIATNVNNTSCIISEDIKPDTFYYWRVRAVLSLSTGDRGPWLTGYFETDKDGYCQAEKLVFLNTSSTSTEVTQPSTPEPQPETTISVSDSQEELESQTNAVQGQVMRVIDGDTIEVSIGGTLYTVRYIGIDTPETVHPTIGEEPYGKEASDKNKALVLNKIVTLEKDVSETDRYGRLLRYVYVGDLLINAELVRLGYAQVSTYPPDVKYQSLFLQLQQEAQAANRGLWGLEEPEPDITTIQNDSGNVQITYIFFNGLVPYTESDEYVQVTNQGASSVDLTEWILKDISEGYPSFTFPFFTLQPGQSIRVYTNEYHLESGGFSFNSDSAVWSNSDPDTAALYNSSGNLVSSLSY